MIGFIKSLEKMHSIGIQGLNLRRATLPGDATSVGSSPAENRYESTERLCSRHT